MKLSLEGSSCSAGSQLFWGRLHTASQSAMRNLASRTLHKSGHEGKVLSASSGPVQLSRVPGLVLADPYYVALLLTAFFHFPLLVGDFSARAAIL